MTPPDMMWAWSPDRFATAIYEYLTEATNHARK